MWCLGMTVQKCEPVTPHRSCCLVLKFPQLFALNFLQVPNVLLGAWFILLSVYPRRVMLRTQQDLKRQRCQSPLSKMARGVVPKSSAALLCLGAPAPSF